MVVVLFSAVVRLVGVAFYVWLSTYVEEGYRQASGRRQNRPWREKDNLNIPRTNTARREMGCDCSIIMNREYMHILFS